MLSKIAVILLTICSVTFFVVPALMSWGVIPESYWNGFLLVEMGLILHALFLFILGETR
jgi:hypothetical protein